MPKFCFSTDEERYQGQHDTREAALDEALDCADEDASVWTAEVEDVDLEALSIRHTDDIIERIEERLYEEVGEASDGNPRCTGDDLRSLDTKIKGILTEWLKGKIHCYKVKNVVCHPPEEVANARLQVEKVGHS